MDDLRTKGYAQKLSALIQKETVSAESLTDKTKFYEFQDLLRALFPRLFSVCEFENFNGSFLMTWRGQGQGEPVLLMNHQDVVEAPGEWKYPPFAGTIADGRVWGRGALDTKGGLFAMLQAAEELLEEGFVPKRDMYFMSTCTEECDGVGAETISKVLLQRGLRFHLVLDEGGMVVINPLTGANGSFAMVGVGEKGCADLKFIARSTGGHASTPEKNTPLVRLGKFMAAVERKQLFKRKISATVSEMFSVLSSSMRGPVKFVLKHTRLFEPILVRVMPWLSNTAAAMLQTTIAFTMADGSAGANVLPQEAWVIGNMRYSHHQGRQKSFRAVAKLAENTGLKRWF